jgi:hypothetical protein
MDTDTIDYYKKTLDTLNINDETNNNELEKYIEETTKQYDIGKIKNITEHGVNFLNNNNYKNKMIRIDEKINNILNNHKIDETKLFSFKQTLALFRAYTYHFIKLRPKDITANFTNILTKNIEILNKINNTDTKQTTGGSINKNIEKYLKYRLKYLEL